MQNNGNAEIVSEYRNEYKNALRDLPKRLPIRIKDEQVLFNRLYAAYSLLVERRGVAFRSDEFTMDKLRLVTQWLFSSEKRGLILMGDVGTGKSTMITAMACLFKTRMLFRNAQAIFDEGKTNDGVPNNWNEPLLFIDDLGIEPPFAKVFGTETYPLTRLLFHRYDNMLTTVIATNLGMSEIQERYGDRVADRMNETYNVIMYSGNSYRGRLK